MVEKHFQFHTAEFAQLTQKYCRMQPGWRKSQMLYVTFFVLAVLVAAACIGLMASSSLIMGAAMAAVFAAPFFATGVIMKNRALLKNSNDFIKMKDPFLYQNFSGIQFGYHDKTDAKSSTSAVVYQISYSNICKVFVDEAQQLITVVGQIEVVNYEDLVANRVRESFTNGQFGCEGSFSFFSCFDGKQEFLSNLQAHDVVVQFK